MLERSFIFKKARLGKDFILGLTKEGRMFFSDKTLKKNNLVIGESFKRRNFLDKTLSRAEFFFNSVDIGRTLIFSEFRWIANEFFSRTRLKFLFKFRYPKLGLFVLCILLSYYIFTDSSLSVFFSHLRGWNYLGAFIAGVLFSFGFTSPFSAGLFLVMKPDNILLTGLVGGLGCLLGDLTIFKFVKISFEEEFLRLKKERPFRFMKSGLKKIIHPKLWNYLIFALAAFFFASPLLPDEAAVTLLAGIGNIDIKKLAVISFTFNTLGILFILAI